MVMKCYKCKCELKKVKNSKHMIRNYVLSDVTAYVCGVCGEKYFNLDEYEKMRKKITAIESQPVQKALAQARAVLL